MTPSALIFTTALLFTTPCVVFSDYWSERNKFVTEEEARTVGGWIQLNKTELIVNEALMTYKNDEIKQGKSKLSSYPASQHFFTSKPHIENSDVFKLIKKLPKGGVLHAHDTSFGSQELLFNMTYAKNLYTCWDNGRLQFYFFNEGQQNQKCPWVLLEEMRKHNSSIDDEIREQFSLVVRNPYVAYPDGNAAWHRFKKIFGVVSPILTYKPVWQQYFYSALEEYYDDNIRYLELRSTLPRLYDLDGKIYDELDVIALYKSTYNDFKQKHPDFHGVKIIYAPGRKVDNATMSTYVKTMKLLKKNYPDFVAGFDLVGQEDLGEPLVNFIGYLQELKSANIPFFFHAGETNWYGSVDENLVDAVLLGTKRIGHGFALAKHPMVLDHIAKNNIVIELCPISNQVLRLVDDLRNHPGTYYIANGYPVIIGNDDPCFWGAKGVSYDWYVAFMALAGEKADLRFLKKIAQNSYVYSTMDVLEKRIALYQFHRDWDAFMETYSASNDEYIVTLLKHKRNIH